MQKVAVRCIGIDCSLGGERGRGRMGKGGRGGRGGGGRGGGAREGQGRGGGKGVEEAIEEICFMSMKHFDLVNSKRFTICLSLCHILPSQQLVASLTSQF